MTLRRKLLAAFAGLVAVATLTAGAALFATLRWQTTASDMETHYRRSLLLQQVRAGTFQALKEVDDALTGDHVDARADFDRALAPATRDFEEWASLADTHAEQGEVERVRQAHARLIGNANQVFALLPQNRSAAIRLVDDEVDTGDYEAFRLLTERAVRADQERRRTVRAETERVRTTTQIMLAVAALSVLSLTLLIAAYLSHDLFAPLRRLAETARRLSVGDLKARADEDEDDEIGEVGRALNALAASIEQASGGGATIGGGGQPGLHALVAELQTKVGELKGVDGKDEGIAEEVERLALAIRRLTDITLPLDLDLEPLDAATLIHGIIARFRGELEQRAISIELNLDEGPDPVLADRLKLREALSQVVRNALDALPEKGGRIGFRTCQADGMVRIEVADSGQGMDSDLIERAMAEDRERLLTGLGLAKAVIERHRGSLALFSESGKGTVARFSLPIRR